MNNFNFGNYICELREKKSLSQSELGEKLGVTNKAVSKWENGVSYPSTKLMLPLAEILGVTIEDLYKAISDSKSKPTKVRIILNFLQSRSLIVSIICFVFALVPYGLFLIFSKSEEKMNFLIVTPIICIIVYTMFRLSFFMARKNPFSSTKGLDIFYLFILSIMIIAYIFIAIELIKNPNSFSPSVCVPPLVFMSIIHTLKKRYK